MGNWDLEGNDLIYGYLFFFLRNPFFEVEYLTLSNQIKGRYDKKTKGEKNMHIYDGGAD